MSLTRRDAIALSGSTLAGVSLGLVAAEELAGQTAPATQQPPQEWPTSLTEMPRRDGFPVELPLNPDGSAPEHPESAAGPIMEGPRPMWRTEDRSTPVIDYDYRNLAVKVDTRGMARLGGTLRFADLESLPRVSRTYLLQCGAARPSGIVKWTGVRFRDVVDMLGVVDGVHYARFIASDRFYVDEDMETLTHPQVLLAWLMNDEPIPPLHGAPLRLVVPFRYGNRSIKAIQEIVFSTPGLPALPIPS